MSHNRESLKKCQIQFLIKIVLSGFIFALIFHHYTSVFLNSSSLPKSFLFIANDAGNDFFNPLEAVKNGDPYGWNVSVYFPFAYALLWLLSWFPKQLSFLIFSIGWVTILFLYLRNSLSRRGIPEPQSSTYSLVLVFLSYPVLFCLDRGNLEGLVLAFLIGFLYFFKRERYVLSAALLAFAAAIKGYPAIYGFLFIRNQKYREVFLSGFLCIFIYLFTIQFFPGGITEATRSLFSNQREFSYTYGLTHTSIPFGLSLFSFIKLLGGSPQTWGPFYNFGALITMCCLCALVSIRKMALWQSVYIITAGLLLLPQVSFDYKLIGLFLPLSCLIDQNSENRFEYFILGLLLIPKAFFYLYYPATVGVVINPLLLVILLCKIVWESRPEAMFNGPKPIHI